MHDLSIIGNNPLWVSARIPTACWHDIENWSFILLGGSHLSLIEPLTFISRVWGCKSCMLPAVGLDLSDQLAVMGNQSFGNSFWQHITLVNWVSIGSSNGLVQNRQQTTFWTNADLLSIDLQRQMQFQQNPDIYSQKNSIKMVSDRFWPICLGINVLTHQVIKM